MQGLKVHQELLAWHAANLMNCWTKKKVTPEKLMGKGSAEPQTFEELQAQMRAQQRKVEKSVAVPAEGTDEIDFGDDEIPVDLSFAMGDSGDTLSGEED